MSLIMGRKAMPTLIVSSAKTLSSLNSFQSSNSTPSSSVVHKFTESMMEENIENAELIIKKWETNSSSSLFHDRKEAKEFLKSIKDLRKAMHFLLSEHAASNKLVLSQNLMVIAMKRLEKELYMILSSHRDQLDPQSVSGRSSNGSSSFEEDDDVGSEEEIEIATQSIIKVERETSYAMSDLKSIADCMISSGYGKECIKIYKLIRKSIVDEGLFLLGVERLKSSQIQKMNWEVLDRRIEDWINAVKIAVQTLFNGEKSLCDHVFSSSQTIRESCFFEITKEAATNLFRFPQLVAMTKKPSPHSIFSLMQLHETLSTLWPEIELTFNSESTSAVKLQALSSLHRLGESVRSVLLEFESSIQKDSSKTLVAGGGVHPLTRTVMDYISSLADYSGILSEIVPDSQPMKNMQLPESILDGSTPAVSLYLAWLILVLLCKLDSKAKGYKDVALSYLFLANNLQFIIEKVCATRLKSLLGQDWVFQHANKVKQYAAGYELMAWNRVFTSMPEKTSQLSPEAARDCFRRFHAAFEEAYKKQKSWIVSDGRLRDELKVSIARKVVPAYREFCDAHLVMLSGEKTLNLFVNFGPDDLENYLSDLFHGDEISDNFSSSSPSLSSLRACICPVEIKERSN